LVDYKLCRVTTYMSTNSDPRWSYTHCSAWGGTRTLPPSTISYALGRWGSPPHWWL